MGKINEAYIIIKESDINLEIKRLKARLWEAPNYEMIYINHLQGQLEAYLAVKMQLTIELPCEQVL